MRAPSKRVRSEPSASPFFVHYTHIQMFGSIGRIVRSKFLRCFFDVREWRVFLAYGRSHSRRTEPKPYVNFCAAVVRTAFSACNTVLRGATICHGHPFP